MTFDPDLMVFLKGKLVLANLGSIGDSDLALPARFVKLLTVLDVDAVGRSNLRAPYHRHIKIRTLIAGAPGQRMFFENTFTGSSSLLEADSTLIADYGLERYYRVAAAGLKECMTVPALLSANGIDRVDFLKTDLEGADYEVLKSCESLPLSPLLIQSELRYQPFYRGEPRASAVMEYLHGRGYDVLTILHTDYWTYRAPHRFWRTYGRAVWSDFLFVRSPEAIEKTSPDPVSDFVRQIVFLAMLGQFNYADHLLKRLSGRIPDTWARELGRLLAPSLSRFARYILRGWRRRIRPLELTARHMLSRSSHATWH